MKVLSLRANFFTTYFLSLVVIFLIPFSILGFTMYHNSVISIKSQIETTSLNQLEQIKYIIDLRLEELSDISVRIAYDPSLTPFMLQNGGYAAKAAINELGKYKANSAIVENIYLYIRGDQMIYSQEGMQSLDVVANRLYRMTEAAKVQLIDELNHTNAPLLRGLGQANQGELITYYYPIRPNDSYFYGTIMYTIKDSVLLNFISGTLRGNEGAVLIYDQSGDIFLKHGEPLQDKDAFSIKAFIQETNASIGTGIQDVHYMGERYSFIRVVSDASGLTFAAIVPSNQFLQPVTQMQRFLLTLMMAIVILGFGTAALIALRNSKPIRDLANFIKNLSNSEQLEKRNNLTQIVNLFTEVYDKQQELKERMSVQKPWAFERILTKLLNGSFRDIHQLTADLDAVGMSLEADYFFVMVVDNTDSDIAGMLPASFRSQVEFAYASELLREDGLAILVGYVKKGGSHRQIQEQAAATLIEILQERGQQNFLIGMGTVHSQLLHTNRSYIEAMGAIEYKFSQSGKNIIFFEDIRERNSSSFRVPFKEKVRFVESLRQTDKQVALEALHSMFRSIEDNEQSVIALKMACNDIILQVHNVGKEFSFEFDEELWKSLLRSLTLSELEGKLTSLISVMCDHIEHSKEKKHNQYSKEILDDIEANYRSYDISLEQIAVKFGVSTSQVSRIVKQSTGTTFLDYLTQLRIQFIKEQLVTTDKRIGTIIREAGYVDASNFIRKFKQTIGMTPGQYRESQRSLPFGMGPSAKRSSDT